MNSKNYHRKINHTKLDKHRKSSIRQKYLNNYENNSYMSLNKNDYNDESTYASTYYNPHNNTYNNDINTLTVLKLTINNFDYSNIYGVHNDENMSIKLIPIFKKENGYHIHNENTNLPKSYKKSLKYIKCIRCNIICNSVYKCLHNTYFDTYSYNSDYNINKHYYDIYYSNLYTGYNLLYNYDDDDNDDDISWLMLSDSVYTTVKNIKIRKTIYTFKYTYYCLKFKQKFRDWLWIYVRKPKITKQYSPNKLNALIEYCNTDEDLFTKLDNW